MTGPVHGVQVGHRGKGGAAADYVVTVRVKSPVGDLLAVKEALAYDLEKYGDVVFVNVETVPESRKGRKTQNPKAPEWAQMTFKV